MVPTFAITVGLVALIFVSGLVAIFSDTQFLKSEKDRFAWRVPLAVVMGSAFVLLVLVVYSPNGGLLFLYVLLAVPIVFLTCLAVLVAAAIRKRPRRCLSALLTLVAFLSVSWGVIRNQGTFRAYFRWLVWSRTFKAEVLAQPAPANGKLKHILWEETGWMEFDGVYLVFDPADSLSDARSPGESKGIPCRFRLVHRLESHWYAVWFYINEDWDSCGSGSAVPYPH